VPARASLAGQLRAASVAIERFEEEIARLASNSPTTSSSRPCPALAPRWPLGFWSFGERRDRFPNAAAVQKYAGVAPVTERSGNKSWVHWRFFCPTFLRQTFIEWVGQTIPRSFWAKAFYDSCRARGTRHQAARAKRGFRRRSTQSWAALMG
jgi:transposase IS116/IS110/IS902 family protein